jgi:hypothetical protein
MRRKSQPVRAGTLPFTFTHHFSTSFAQSILAVMMLSLAISAEATLTHRYSFNDGTASDQIAGADGVLVNGASANGGRLFLNNNGVSSDPQIGQYVSLPYNILQTGNFTLETWFTWNGGNAWQRLLDFGTPLGTRGKDYMILTMNTSKKPLGQISINGSTDAVFGSPAFPVGGEHCIAWCYSSETKAQEFYLDGVLMGSSTAGAVNPAAAAFSNFYLGRSQFAAEPLFSGSIDELRTYDVALTSGQIQSEFAAGPDFVAVPEPNALLLLGLGGFAGVVWRVFKGRR